MADTEKNGVSLFRERISALEESYEFMLAYAAQGITGESLSQNSGSGSSGQLREFLRKADEALDGLTEAFARIVASAGLEPRKDYDRFGETLRKDVEASRSAMSLTLAQERISSQLVDNLNASIHIRALLTDLFFLDEVLKEATRDKEPSRESSAS